MTLLGKILDKSPIPYVSARTSGSLFPQGPTANNTAYMQAMSTSSTLYAIVSRLASATSQVEWKLYRKSQDGRRAYGYEAPERREVTKHLALDIWNNPNPFYTRQEFVETIQQHVDLTGEAYWAVSTNSMASFPMELWPIRPDKMTPVPSAETFLAGWVYTTPDGGRIPFEPDQIIQVRMPNPLDPYRGMGPVQSLLTVLDSSKYAERYNRNFFINSAEPGGIIQVDRRLDDVEFQEFNERWKEQHRGVSNAHRVAIIEEGTWIDRKYTMKDMQFTELRGVTQEQIREAFGFPKPMLGTVEDVNRANAEAAEVVFSRWLLKPRLERIKQALNSNFLPLFGTAGQGVEFDYCDPTPEDEQAEAAELTSKVDAADKLIGMGFDPLEVLAALGLPELTYEKPQPPVQIAPPQMPDPQMPAVEEGDPNAEL